MTKATALLTLLLPSAAGFALRSGRIRNPLATSSSPSSSSLAAKRLEAILFDCDGVLADTEPDGHRVGFNIAFAQNDIAELWTKERYGKLLETGGGKERMTAHWNEVGWPEQIPEEGRQDKVKSLHLQKTDIFMKLIDDGKIPLRPGVLALVDEAIANNVRLAVCSTSNELAVSNLVSTLMGPDRAAKFQIFAGDMVKAKKPAPDVYNMAVDEMGLDKSRCVIVEDSHIGVGAAVASGMSCLVTKSSYTQDEDFTGAKMIVDELEGDGVTLETLEGLLDGDEELQEVESSAPPRQSTSVNDPPSPWDPVGHIETSGVSWTGARLGDETPTVGRSYTASETYEPSGKRSIGARMVRHIEAGGASWTGARFGEENANAPVRYTASETFEATNKQRGIGVGMESHVEKGGASWTGARFGEENINEAASPYRASETVENDAKKSPGVGWDAASHTEISEGADESAWSGARLGERDERRCAPTPSRWHE